MPTGDGRRPARIAARIRALLSEALSRDLADPRLGGVAITSVDVGPDLATARVGVRLVAGDGEAQRRRLLAALRGAAGRLRRDVAVELRLRRAPALEFRYDTGPDAARRVEDLLAEIAAEERGGTEPGPGDPTA